VVSERPDSSAAFTEPGKEEKARQGKKNIRPSRKKISKKKKKTDGGRGSH